ncbi:hypothetical protein JMA_04150 [Jeotgalibacillus malaysiensis]|uniref:Uncharacterized protein n=1 Tax=Jeotgalibacillus malaysiensis TaxID=1508404 RepID=A0A0B5AM33_9BACL|nr:hypothetical protein [Jeotgalibacillus malaysiensis]AJD89732.1 hypothetical protein JMA_04150 [Jeotgalibacillus malaysiensis]
MSRKQIGFIGLFIIVVIGIVVYLIERMHVPAAFLAEEKILAALSKDSEDTELQDKIQIDEETYFVPYVSEGNRYGKSIWKWLSGDWEMVSESEATGPSILQGESEKYIYWNIHPEDEVKELEFYLIRDRNYSVSYPDFENESTLYLPHLQVSHTVETGDKTYGFAKFPSDLEEISEALQTNQEMSQGILPSNIYTYRWQALNADGERKELEETRRGGGGGSHTGNYVQFMSELNEGELE